MTTTRKSSQTGKPLCISSILGAAAPSEPFFVPVHGYGEKISLQYCDFSNVLDPAYDKLDSGHHLADAVIIALQKSKDPLIKAQLRQDAPNLFFSFRRQKFFVVTWVTNGGWVRNPISSLNNLSTKEARFFVPATT